MLSGGDETLEPLSFAFADFNGGNAHGVKACCSGLCVYIGEINHGAGIAWFARQIIGFPILHRSLCRQSRCAIATG